MSNQTSNSNQSLGAFQVPDRVESLANSPTVDSREELSQNQSSIIGVVNNLSPWEDIVNIDGIQFLVGREADERLSHHLYVRSEDPTRPDAYAGILIADREYRSDGPDEMRLGIIPATDPSTPGMDSDEIPRTTSESGFIDVESLEVLRSDFTAALEPLFQQVYDTYDPENSSEYRKVTVDLMDHAVERRDSEPDRFDGITVQLLSHPAVEKVFPLYQHSPRNVLDIIITKGEDDTNPFEYRDILASFARSYDGPAVDS
jgi:hypothetical protein